MATYYEDAGKGDYRRKRQVDKETFEKNWDAIFGRKEAPTQLCESCQGKGGSWDCGWYYECSSCKK